MAKHYNLKNIRTLLIEGFSDEELRRICYDNLDFKPLYQQLSRNAGKTEIIDKLIEYADRKILMENLLTLAQKSNPARYKTHQPYYSFLDKPSTSDIAPETKSPPTAIVMDALEQILENPEDARFFAARYSRNFSKTIDSRDGFQAIITKLVMHCDAKGEYDRLWTLIKDQNQKIYQKFYPEFRESLNGR